MPILIRRGHSEREGARQLLIGFADHFEVLSYILMLHGSDHIEQIGRDLAADLRRTVDAQARQIEAAQQLTVHWQAQHQSQLDENARQHESLTFWRHEARAAADALAAAQHQLARAEARLTQVQQALNSERTGRAAEVQCLETKISDLNRIVATQHLDLLRLRGEEVGAAAAPAVNHTPDATP